MSVQEIEAAIAKLPPSDLAKLADWFADYQRGQDGGDWNRAFAETTDDDLDNLVAFARAQAATAQPTDEALRGCSSGRDA